MLCTDASEIHTCTHKAYDLARKKKGLVIKNNAALCGDCPFKPLGICFIAHAVVGRKQMLAAN